MSDGTVLNPIIYLDTITYDNVVYPHYPLGGISTSVLIRYGKNQPFPMAVVKVQKNFYNSMTYWGTQTDGHGQPITEIPEITDGVTPIVIQAYGTSEAMTVEKHETSGSYITLTCYAPSYKLKTTKLSSIASFVYTNSAFAYSYASPLSLVNTAGVARSTSTSGIPRFILQSNIVVGSVTYKVYFQVERTANTDGTYTVDTEYVFGTPAALFAFIAVCGAGYGTDALLIDNGYLFTNAGAAIDIDSSTSYTTTQLGTFKTSAHNATLPYYLATVKLRTDAYCWAQILALGYMANCTPFFYDFAYFVDYNSVNSTENYQSDKSVTIDYGGATEDQGGCSEVKYSSSGTAEDAVYHDLTYIASNEDQGSTYVRYAQEVDAENFKQAYDVSDTTAKDEGDAVYLSYPCLDSQSYPGVGDATHNVIASSSSLPTASSGETAPFLGDIAYTTTAGTLGHYWMYTASGWVNISDLNYPRNACCATIGLNLLIRYYQPGDCVAIQMCEVQGNTPTVTFPASGEPFTSFDALMAATGMTDGSVAEVYEDGFTSFYTYNGTQWAFSDYGSDRIETFMPYTRVETLTDNQNSITIANAPLACTELVWPSCETTIWFGMPEFMDSAQQLSSLGSITQDSSTTNTTDSDISDKFAAKLVIGSQALSELEDDRAGFTGLIMEKNWNNDLYRLAGYDSGTLNAYFNSDGCIMSGNGSVILSSTGINIGSGSTITLGPVKIDSTGLTLYTSSAQTTKILSLTGSGLIGNGFSLGTGGLYLNGGTISMGGTTLSSSGININGGTISIGSTLINSSGITATSGTIGGNTFDSNGIVISKGSVNFTGVTINSSGVILGSGQYLYIGNTSNPVSSLVNVDILGGYNAVKVSIQSDIVNTGKTIGNIAITFPHAFARIPTVIVQPCDYYQSSSHIVGGDDNNMVFNVSERGFSFRHDAHCGEAMWFAIGWRE